MPKSLQQAIEEGQRFKVQVMPDLELVAAELFITPAAQTIEGDKPAGVLLVQTEWPEPFSAPRLHFMEGEPKPTATGWTVGRWSIAPLDLSNDGDRRWWEAWERAQAFYREEYGADCSREAAARVASKFHKMEVKP